MMKKTTMFIVTFLATILIVSLVPVYLYLNAQVDQGSVNPEAPSPIVLNKFSSYEELKGYVEESPQGGYYTFDGRGMGVLESAPAPMSPPSAEPAPASESSAEAADAGYSTTNIQVAGVDEADIIKTDGEYIYMISNNTIIILKAYPAEEAEVLSRINSNGTIRGIFINEDKLVVFEDEYAFYTLYGEVAPSIAPDSEPFMATYETPKTSIKVYDVSDREDPVLTRDFAIDGNYFNSRMIGDYVYAITNQYTYMTENDDVVLPNLYSGTETEEIPATDIFYYNVSDYYYTFTTIVAVNVQDDAEEPNHETVLLGSSRAIYVSLNSIYLTFPEYPMNMDETERTAINRVGIDEESITFEATGVVPGSVLDQFSMSEHNGYFRIATTSGHISRTFAQATSENHLYVLDMDLNVTGKLEALAPGEDIHSVRFMGDKGYIVTFRKIDPLFVIDLTDPTDPTVLGQLKVTGYSDYLHPYDENHLIGIGKETEAAEDGDFAWYQGVKISLFDVSDVSHPVEIAKYEIGDRGTESPVLDDHKALLFDKSRNLLVIPVLVAEIDETQYAGEVPSNAYGEFVWQGAYVFDISLDGIEYRGGITHLDDNADLLKSGYWFYSEYSVERSLYIDSVLYTISAMKVKMNNLETLAEINQVELS